MLKKRVENRFTFGPFKLFLPKYDFAFLHIILWRAGNIKKMKNYVLGINEPIS